MSKNDAELCGEVKKFIGDSNLSLVEKTSPKELKLFQKFPIDLNKSYIVFGTPELLRKFKAFFLTRCVKKRPSYSQFSMYEYASALSSATKDEYGLNIDIELIFLYRHTHTFSFGNSEVWLLETVLNKIADRNREGLSTVILTETRMEYLEESGELIFINLSGNIALDERKKVLSSYTQGENIIQDDYNDYD